MSSIQQNIKDTVLISFYTGLLVVGAYTSIPLATIPVILTDFFVILTSLMLGYKKALLVTILYVIIGTIGLPVFSSGKGGLSVLLGPTGGYIVSYIPASFLIGLISRISGGRNFYINLIASLIGATVILSIGTLRLSYILDTPFTKALVIGFTPFIVIEIIKVVIASFLAMSVNTTLYKNVPK